MRTTARWIATLLAAAAPAAPASAAGSFYLGGGGGGSTFEAACSGVDETGFDGRCDENGSSKKLLVGYRFRPWLGLEASLNDFGRASLSGDLQGLPITGEVEASGATLAAVAELGLTQNTSVVFKLGAGRWDLESRGAIAGTGVTTAARASGVSPLFGLGFGFRVGKRLELRFEVEEIADVGEPDTTGSGDLNYGTLAAIWRF